MLAAPPRILMHYVRQGASGLAHARTLQHRIHHGAVRNEGAG